MSSSGADDPCYVAATSMNAVALVMGAVLIAGLYVLTKTLVARRAVKVCEAYLKYHHYAVCTNDIIANGGNYGNDHYSAWRYGLYFVASMWKQNGGDKQSLESKLKDSGVDPAGISPLESTRRGNMAIEGDRSIPVTYYDLKHPVS